MFYFLIIIVAAVAGYYFMNRNNPSKVIKVALDFQNNEVEEISRLWWTHCGYLNINNDPTELNNELNNFLGLYFGQNFPTVGRLDKITSSSVREYIKSKHQSALRGDLEKEYAQHVNLAMSSNDIPPTINEVRPPEIDRNDLRLMADGLKIVQKKTSEIFKGWKSYTPQLGEISDDKLYLKLNEYIQIWLGFHKAEYPLTISGKPKSLMDNAVFDYIQTVVAPFIYCRFFSDRNQDLLVTYTVQMEPYLRSRGVALTQTS